MTRLYEFRLWGQTLVSDLDLGLAERFSDGRNPTPIRLRSVPHSRVDELKFFEPLVCTNDKGEIWLKISKSDSAYLLDFVDLCLFRIDPAALLIEYAPDPTATPSTIVHLILDHALPRLISLLKNHFVLHASAWVVGGKAVMAVGQSGAGKSTMASWFGRHGYPILTDDCLVLHRDSGSDPWMAQPSYPSVRLWPDSIDALGIDSAELREFAHYSGKRRTADQQGRLFFATDPAPLGGAFSLRIENSSGPTFEACSVNEAFAAVSLGVFRLEIASPEINQREFEILTDLVERTPFWSISHSNDYANLAEMEQRVLQVMR